jgi:ABC-type phosphate/phosphonate transport system permease subunit
MVDVNVDEAWLKLVSFFGFLFCTYVFFLFCFTCRHNTLPVAPLRF